MKKHLLLLLCGLLAAFNIHAQTSVGYKDGWPRPNATVNAIAVSGNIIYIGGWFTSVGGQTRNHLAAYDATTGALLPWNPDADDAVYALAVSGNMVYAGGQFLSIGGQSRMLLAALDATTGALTAWSPNPSHKVYSIAVSGNTVYVGGWFTSIGFQMRNHVAAIDATTGNATLWNPNANSNASTGTNVNALAVSGNTVYIGGNFTSVGGQTRNLIAAIDASTGLPTSWNPNATSINPGAVVNALAVSGNTVYVGGDFNNIGGQNRNRIAAIDATTGNATSWNPDATWDVYALGVGGRNVYAGGWLLNVGGQGSGNLVALDTTLGSVTPWAPNAGDFIRAIAVNGNNVYVGGDFQNMAGDTTRRYFMALTDSNTVLGVSSAAVLGEGFSFSTFPNPAGGKVMVRANGAVSQTATVQVMSLLGAAVKEMKMQNGEAEINLSGMASGVYLLRYKDAEGRTGMTRLLKQ